MGYVDFYTFLIPLYGLSLGLDASEIGILVGGRSILALFLSIHIGVLMDRFGTRKVTLFFVWTGMALAPLFPLVPGFWTLLLLQLISGAAVSFAWSGAQTLIAQLARGRCRIYRQVQLFRAVRLDDGADSRRRRLGLWRSLAGLSPRRPLGRGVDDRIAAHAGGRDLWIRAKRRERSECASARAMSCRELRTTSTRLCWSQSRRSRCRWPSFRCAIRRTASRPRSMSSISTASGSSARRSASCLRPSRLRAGLGRCLPGERCGGAIRSARC